jgi:hypothetical protein
MWFAVARWAARRTPAGDTVPLQLAFGQQQYWLVRPTWTPHKIFATIAPYAIVLFERMSP